MLCFTGRRVHTAVVGDGMLLDINRLQVTVMLDEFTVSLDLEHVQLRNTNASWDPVGPSACSLLPPRRLTLTLSIAFHPPRGPGGGAQTGRHD
jgi:hypothetical protein